MKLKKGDIVQILNDDDMGLEQDELYLLGVVKGVSPYMYDKRFDIDLETGGLGWPPYRECDLNKIGVL